MKKTIYLLIFITIIYGSFLNSDNSSGNSFGNIWKNEWGGGWWPPHRQKYTFDARDDFRSEDDRNISTKIVNKDFNVTLMAINKNTGDEEDFTGTVCAKIIADNYKSDWNKTTWNNEKEKNATLISTNGIKKGYINIIFYQNDTNANCPDQDGDINSTDNFAIRPLKYQIVLDSNPKYAGVDFNISFIAKDYIDNNTTDYNESINNSFEVNITDIKNCKIGDFTPDINDSWSFADGNNTIQTNYSEVGELNISINEKSCSDRFAAIDCKDANVSGHWNSDVDTKIEDNNTIFYISPYELNITDANISVLHSPKWVYDANISDFNATTLVEIKSYNKQGDITQNFDSACYAKDINITFGYDVVNKNSDVNLSYDGNITSFDKSINDVNKTLQIPKTLFNNGIANSSYAYNIDRNFTIHLDPINLKLVEANITTSAIAKYENNKTLDDNVTFYYGSLILNDIVTTQNDFNKTYYFGVYDSQTDLKPTNTLVGFNWYYNHLHTIQDGNVSDSEIILSKDYNSSNTISGIDVSVNKQKDGYIVFDINRTDTSKTFGVVHLLSPNLKWLWYMKFAKDYNISDGSTCLEHFCFNITFKDDSNTKEVGSGDFKGSEVNLTTTHSDTHHLGIKIYR